MAKRGSRALCSLHASLGVGAEVGEGEGSQSAVAYAVPEVRGRRGGGDPGPQKESGMRFSMIKNQGYVQICGFVGKWTR